MKQFRPYTPKVTGPEINQHIRSATLRVIDQDGEQLGIIDTKDALLKAEEVGLDLVVISPNAEPPVAKIIDYGKYLYQQSKKEVEQKKHQHQIKEKEIKIRPGTGEHDIETKTNHARKFLERGDKVKILCMVKRGQMSYKEHGIEWLNKMAADLSDVSKLEVPLQPRGALFFIVLSPLSSKGKAKPVKKEGEKGEAPQAAGQSAASANGQAKEHKPKPSTPDATQDE